MKKSRDYLKSLIKKKVKIEFIRDESTYGSTYGQTFREDCKNLIFTIKEVRLRGHFGTPQVILTNDNINNPLRKWILNVYFYNSEIMEDVFKIIPINCKYIVI